MGIVVGIISILTDDIVPVPLNGVNVRIYDGSDVFLAGGQTGVFPDDPGTFSFSLDGAPDPGTQYIVRLQKNQVSFPAGPTMTVNIIDPLVPPVTNIFDVVGHNITLPESLNPDLCLLSGFLVDVSLRPIRNRTVEFKPLDFYPDIPPGFTAHFPGFPSIVNRNVLLESVKAKTDDNGLLQVSLPRGGGYKVHIYGVENPVTITEHILVPDQAGFALEDLIFNYVKQVTYIGGPFSVAVGSFIDIEVDVRGSNQVRIERVEDLAKLVKFSTSDDSAAVVTIRDKNVVTVSGLAPGTVTLQVDRLPNTMAPRRPDVGAIIATPPSVAVS
jgi:hypothetical protein